MDTSSFWEIDFKQVYDNVTYGFWMVHDFLDGFNIKIGDSIEFSFWVLLLAFFTLDALIFILLSRKPKENKEDEEDEWLG